MLQLLGKSRLWFLLVLGGLWGCSDASQITIEVVHSEAPSDAEVFIRVRRVGGETAMERTMGEVRWPVSLAVVPKEGNLSGEIEAEVQVSVDGEIATQTQRTRFEDGENVVLEFRFGPPMPGDGGIPDADAGFDAPRPDGSIPDAGLSDAATPPDAATTPDAATPPDAGLMPGCLPFEAPDGTPLNALDIAGHSFVARDIRRDYLAILTASHLMLFSRSEGDGAGCFTQAQVVNGFRAGSWAPPLALGHDGRHIIVAAAFQSGSNRSVQAAFGLPGDALTASVVLRGGPPDEIVVGGQGPEERADNPFVAVRKEGQISIFNRDGGSWTSIGERRGNRIFGLPNGLLVVVATNVQLWRFSASDGTVASSGVGIEAPVTAGGVFGSTTYVAGAFRSSVHQRSRSGDLWGFSPTVTLSSADSFQPALLGNYSHWLAAIPPESRSMPPRVAWCPFGSDGVREVTVDSTLTLLEQSSAVFPFGFAYLNNDRHVRIRSIMP